MPFDNFDPVGIVVFLVGLSLAPFLAMMVSSFVKISCVLNLVRNALGVQQVPPNLVLNGIALVLSIYIMAPVASQTTQLILRQQWQKKSVPEFLNAAEQVKEPIQTFLYKHTSERQRMFFVNTAKRLWPKEHSDLVTQKDLLVLVPAFTVAELTAAFEIGFLLYLPFIAVDLIVSNVLLAMGMMMVSPMTISLPFKLMLFVLVNGWSKLIEGLVLTY